LGVITILNWNRERPSTGQKMVKFLIKKLTSLFEESEVDFAYLGGSWVSNVQNWWSDIDIFISVPKFQQLSSRRQLNLLTRLHVKATDLTSFEEIEILILESLPLHVQFNAIAKGILLYEKNSKVRSFFLEKLLPLYYDHMIWYENLIDQSEFVSSLR